MRDEHVFFLVDYQTEGTVSDWHRRRNKMNVHELRQKRESDDFPAAFSAAATNKAGERGWL